MRKRRTAGAGIGIGLVAAAVLGHGGTTFGQIGACCRGDGVCIATDAPGCTAITDEFLGAGTACAPNICLGACCSGDANKSLTAPDTRPIYSPTRALEEQT